MDIKWSHSKLNTIMTCPMSYYLNYIQGISVKKEKSAFAIGSAVHWGIEHNTDDLTEYWQDSFATRNNYTKEQLMAESMVYGYLKHKDNIMYEILHDEETGETATILEEIHELSIVAKLKSFKFEEAHNFLGIIDLLLLTDKGFILIDYKTSSQTPDWDKYLEQIYRYIFLLKSEFPDTPIYKIGIVNLRKTSIKQKQNENNISFLNRLKLEYELNENNYINTHMFEPKNLDSNLIETYITNLSHMVDAARVINDNKLFFINFNNAVSVYGKSDYWDIFYNTTDAHLLYKIRDYVYDEIEDDFVFSRDCNSLDLETIKDEKIINHFEQFKTIFEEHSCDLNDFKQYLIDNNYKIDDSLLDLYLYSIIELDRLNKYKKDLLNKYNWIEPIEELENDVNNVKTYKELKELEKSLDR